jgi:hypothetical protein
MFGGSVNEADPLRAWQGLQMGRAGFTTRARERGGQNELSRETGGRFLLAKEADSFANTDN